MSYEPKLYQNVHAMYFLICSWCESVNLCCVVQTVIKNYMKILEYIAAECWFSSCKI